MSDHPELNHPTEYYVLRKRKSPNRIWAVSVQPFQIIPPSSYQDTALRKEVFPEKPEKPEKPDPLSQKIRPKKAKTSCCGYLLNQ